MELHVVINGRKDLAEQLYQQLREAIATGRLSAGAQLPPADCSPNNWASRARPCRTPTPP